MDVTSAIAERYEKIGEPAVKQFFPRITPTPAPRARN